MTAGVPLGIEDRTMNGNITPDDIRTRSFPEGKSRVLGLCRHAAADGGLTCLEYAAAVRR